MVVLRRTWLSTTLFVLVSTAVWWKIAGWGTVWKQLPPTLLLSPLVWWFMVGRQSRPPFVRGVLAGGIVGFVTQSAQDIPKLMHLFARRGTGDGEDQLIAVASATVYLWIGLCATVIGALLGFLATVVQRRVDSTTLGS